LARPFFGAAFFGFGATFFGTGGNAILDPSIVAVLTLLCFTISIPPLCKSVAL
jgi:hypothetical protein